MIRYVEVTVAAAIDSDDLIAELESTGIAGAWEGERSVQLYWAQCDWRADTLEVVRAAVRQLGCTADCVACQAVDADWNALWAESLAPLAIGSRIIVRQSWHVPSDRPEAIQLVIDPMRAFGTGHHASTHLVLEALEATVHGGERVLDAGTGSGILAMAALRLGAATALGVDLDPVAIECARGYACANGFGPELELRAASLEQVVGEFALVLANLDRPTLVASAPLLPALLAGQGRLLVSGILVEDRTDVVAALEAAELSLRGERMRDGWLALELVAPRRQ